MMPDDLMLSGDFEWGDPLPKESERRPPLDPDFVRVLSAPSSIISPDQIRTTLARVDVNQNVAIDGTRVEHIWVAHLHTGDYVRVIIERGDRVYQVRVGRAMEDITFSIPTYIASELRRQVEGLSDYGSEPGLDVPFPRPTANFDIIIPHLRPMPTGAVNEILSSHNQREQARQMLTEQINAVANETIRDLNATSGRILREALRHQADNALYRNEIRQAVLEPLPIHDVKPSLWDTIRGLFRSER